MQLDFIKLDWSIIIATSLNSLVIYFLVQISKQVKRAVVYLQQMSFRVDVMWAEFQKEHPDLAHYHSRSTDI